MTPSALLDPSSDALLCARLVERFGQEGAHEAIDRLVAEFTTVELAALAKNFCMWGRPKQLPPDTDWISFGTLAGRGYGKSEANAQYLVSEVQADRVMRIGGAAQNETKTVEAQIAPLIAASPPWFRPEHEVGAMRLRWPNGATYLGFTPEAPDAIRSENFDMVWMSELQSWPATTRDEAYSNFLFACRIGLARRMWDATPKRGHLLLKKLLQRAEKDPERHIVRRGSMYENPHLTATSVRELEAEYGGTTKGREELHGEYIEDNDDALVKASWISEYYRPQPRSLRRRIVSVDPATTSGGSSDRTGMVDLGLADDGQLLVLGNHSKRTRSAEWVKTAIRLYIDGACDLLLIETNKGGDLLFDVIALEAQKLGLKAERVAKGIPAGPHRRGVIAVREVYGQGPKEDRAQPMATAYEAGRISHVTGAPGIADLEEWLTTWEPRKGMRSPDALDALAHGVVELIGRAIAEGDARANMRGLPDAMRTFRTGASPVAVFSKVFGPSRTRGRI